MNSLNSKSLSLHDLISTTHAETHSYDHRHVVSNYEELKAYLTKYKKGKYKVLLHADTNTTTMSYNTVLNLT